MKETDEGVKRNAFIMLLNTATEKAIHFFQTQAENVPRMDQFIQLAIIELIQKDCRNPNADKVNKFQDNSQGEIYSLYFFTLAFFIIFRKI